ncbi:uncharacterized protein BJ212DRAFT_897657 [Suillus subaureus]|uniref:Transmembrane protein n=1 Tax=Suillus subaureus TaxID=48587 RepID=A0A9P7J602_9AGAM|nr:uncharacterized protein BJ212DRAFT_897657 [Suillus subaureus]KAG1804405.1 hypothetical protein BJ212DRAFT_897657 [Suillus subaureus]
MDVVRTSSSLTRRCQCCSQVQAAVSNVVLESLQALRCSIPVLDELPLINSSTAAVLLTRLEEKHLYRGLDHGNGQADCASCSCRTIGSLEPQVYFGNEHPPVTAMDSVHVGAPLARAWGLFCTALLTIVYSAMIFVYQALCLQAQSAKDFIITITRTTTILCFLFAVLGTNVSGWRKCDGMNQGNLGRCRTY